MNKKYVVLSNPIFEQIVNPKKAWVLKDLFSPMAIIAHHKINDPIIITCVILLITLFFHSEFDEKHFFLIEAHQDDLEHREQHPGGVQQ